MNSTEQLIHYLTFRPVFDWAVIEMRDFRGIVFDVVRLASGRLDESTFESPEIGKNYFSVIAELKEQRIQILASSNFPVFAFADECQDWSFIDVPAFTTAFSCAFPRFKVMSMEELGARTAGLKLEGIGKTMLSDLKYWKPKTIGEILFSEWD